MNPVGLSSALIITLAHGAAAPAAALPTLAGNHSLHQHLPLQFLGDGWGLLLQEERKQNRIALSTARTRSCFVETGFESYYSVTDIFFTSVYFQCFITQ